VIVTRLTSNKENNFFFNFFSYKLFLRRVGWENKTINKLKGMVRRGGMDGIY